MGIILVYQFLDINVLNYCYFHTDYLTFFLNKKRWKNKKNVKNVFFYRKIKKTFINVYYNYDYDCARTDRSCR